jgi:drug/metabolite transporter (DMT)-like permease
MLPYYLALAGGIGFGVLGQILLKTGAERSRDLVGQFLDPFTIVGFGVYVIAAFCYIAAIKRIPLSVAFPSVSLSYVVVALLAHFLWNEPFGLQQLAGIALIGGGIIVLHYH